MPKIIHYRNKCIGCNSCFEHAPSQWRISVQDGKSVLIGARKKRHVYILEIEDFELAQNKRAAKDCPVNIIRVQE